MPSVFQEWVLELPRKQQAVVALATRGPDGFRQEHPSKQLVRYYRRCVLTMADGRVVLDPYAEGFGGGFMRPCPNRVEIVRDDFLSVLDELPLHYTLHFLHAAEIVGYRHPHTPTGRFWHGFYCGLVHRFHLATESASAMDARLKP